MNGNDIESATRKQLLAQYQKDNIEFVATTRPYFSTVAFCFDVVDASPAAAPTMAHAVLRDQTTLDWFGYGLGQQIPLSPQDGIFTPADSCDTNLSHPRKTNGVEDFVIEGVSAARKCLRIVYAAADIPAAFADQAVKDAYAGKECVRDPAALMFPPQVDSPVNLEDLFYEALKPNVSIEFVWDRRNFIPVGTLMQIPEGAAKSYVRASGEPTTSNRYKVPEGYVWRRTDKPDGDFAVRATVCGNVIVPISLVSLGAPLVAALKIPKRICLDVALRVHGLGLAQPGQNVG